MQYHKVERGIIPMKNSDMKVIAIILSIALFFTIVTSNAVSIASVVFLAKGQTATEGTVDASGDATNTDANANTNTNTNNTATPETTAPAANSGSTADTTAPAGNSGSTATPDATQPAGDAGAAAGELTADAALAMYQKAAKEIHTKGIAGYTKKGWQAVEGDLQLSKANFLAGTLTSLIKGFMTEESAAEEKVNAKGSDDAKNRMPISDCAKSYIKSVTSKTEGDNYIITIVLNDQVNPSYSDKDGLVKMSREFLDINDVKKTVTEDETVSKVVSKLDGTINYKAYTITAKMTKDGKFIEITHYGVGDIKADLTAVGVGDLSASGALSFNAKYYDFKY